MRHAHVAAEGGASEREGSSPTGAELAREATGSTATERGRGEAGATDAEPTRGETASTGPEPARDETGATGVEPAREGSGPTGAELARGANLLGALSLAVADRVRAATEAGAGQRGSAPAALVSLAGYLDGRPIEALRDPLRLTHSAAVRLVDRLATGRYVRRGPGRDGRSVAVQLTPSGRRAAARALAARREALEAALAGLTAGERAELARLHEKLLAALTDGRTTAGNICRLCDADACGHAAGRCPVTRGADAAEAAVRPGA